MVQQFLLEGRSLDELARDATELYGTAARIVRAERVLDPGLAGFLGRRHLEVTVEVPDAPAPSSSPSSSSPPPSSPPAQQSAPAGHELGGRAGILALLDSADRAEDTVNEAVGAAHAPGASPDPVSTQSAGLAELLARLGDQQERGSEAAATVPVPLSAAGDLVLVLGLEDSPLRVAWSLVAHLEGAGALVARYGGGILDADGPGVTSAAPDRARGRRLVTRWDAAEARAMAVEAGATVLAAYGLGSPTAGLPHLDGATALCADQVWVVVDARHKPDETAAWVERVRAAVEVDALAVVGAGDSRTARTVNQLGLPIGWVDGQPAPRTVL